MTLAIPGLALQILGWALGSWLVGTAGSLLLCVGLCFYAKAKGRHFAWGLFGWFSLVGLVILAVLPDRTEHQLSM